jgi:hypothetical protein
MLKVAEPALRPASMARPSRCPLPGDSFAATNLLR